MSGFASYAEKIDAQKVRARSESFFDHFSQATLFYNSQSEPEQDHIVKALRFELGKVETPAIRERMVYILSQIDKTLASRVAEGLGIDVPKKIEGPLNMNVPADGNPKQFQPKRNDKEVGTSPALSMENTIKDTVKTRKVAVLAADGFDGAALKVMKKALTDAGAQAKIVAPRLGSLKGAGGEEVKIDFSFLTAASVLFDAVYVPGGEQSVASLKLEPDAIHFVNEAYKHCKAVAATGAGVELLRASYVGATGGGDGADAQGLTADEAVVTGPDGQARKVAAGFVKAIAKHRNWAREKVDQVPA